MFGHGFRIRRRTFSFRRDKSTNNKKEELIWERVRPIKVAKKRSKLGLALGLIGGGLFFFKGMEKLNDYLDMAYAPEEREKLVVLGSGWAAISLLKTINTHKYDVTVISPNNYFLFTPLLSKVAIGTISIESITEPVRRFTHGRGFTFYEAKATDIDLDGKKVQCESSIDGSSSFNIDYDKLIIAVGGVINHLNIKGSKEHTYKLKDVNDSIQIRNKLIDCVELASLPTTSEEDKKRLLSFVIVGGSPMACEFAANLNDYFRKNLNDTNPELAKYFSLTIVKTKDHIHNYYDQSISHAMKNYFKRDLVQYEYGDIIEVKKDSIVVKDNENKPMDLPFGMCIWATGTSIHPLANVLRRKIKDVQHNERALVTDMSLRVQGTDDVFAMGDCATIDQGALLSKWNDVFKKADVNNDGTIDLDEFQILVNDLSRTYPALKAINKSTFEEFDVNNDHVLSADEFKLLLAKFERTLTRFPSTATVASQQGDFLAYNLNKGKYDPDEEDDGDKKEADDEDRPVFRYKHIGGYEYVGAEDGFVERGSKGSSIVTGPGALWMWRAAYFSRVVSKSIRFRGLYDWFHRNIFKEQGTRV